MDTLTHGLSGKAKLALEAAAKVVRGEQLIKEGKLELANLFPDSDNKTIANRVLKYSKDKQETKTKPKENKVLSSEKDRILKAISESEWMTLSRLMKTTGIGWYLMNKIVRELSSKGIIKQIKKTKNPNHKDTSSYNKEYLYWVTA